MQHSAVSFAVMLHTFCTKRRSSVHGALHPASLHTGPQSCYRSADPVNHMQPYARFALLYSTVSALLCSCPRCCPTDLQIMSTVCRLRIWTRLCRVRLVREQVVRIVAFVYLAIQIFGTTPSVLKAASIAQIHALPFLARYSNTSTLVTTSLAFMVRPL